MNGEKTTIPVWDWAVDSVSYSPRNSEPRLSGVKSKGDFVVSGQSGRSEGFFQLDGPKVRKSAVIYEARRPKKIGMNDLRNWTVLRAQTRLS